MTTVRNGHSSILLKALIISVFTLLTPISASPGGNMIAQKGQKALLEYTIDIEGNASGSDYNNQYQKKWSTKRTLVAKAMLTAQHPSAQDPGEPGGQHRAFSKSKSGNTEFKPSNETAKYMAEMEKCGNDMNCRMRIAQKMQNDPNVVGDMNKGKKIAKAEKGPARYQMWTVERKSAVTGSVKMEVKSENHVKALDEHAYCAETAEAQFENLISGSTWPATIRIDAEAGTYAANFDIPSKVFQARIDCKEQNGPERSERHETSGRKFLPEKYQQGSLDDIEVFRGGADGASGGKRLAHGEKSVTGIYGDLFGKVPMAAKITVRWSITLKN